MPDSTHPYDRPSDPGKRHSAALTDGPDRAGARSMLKAVGFTDEDLAKPLIGVATTWIETMPCNINQRRLAEFVKEGIRAAGGTPMEFGTVSVSDGVTMGTEGMKASLISREVIADSIELVVRGHLLDGVVCLTGCDKTTPGAAMALGRLDVPGLILYNGTIYPGTYKGQRNATVVSVYEAIGQYRAGKISLDDLYEIENVACPGRGSLWRPVHRQHDEHGDGVPRHQPRRTQRHPGRGPGQGRGRPAQRGAGDGPGPRRPPAVRVRHARLDRERDRLGRRDGRQHERRPPHARDRPRVRHPARDRRVRGHRRPDPDRRRHVARWPLPRVRPVRRRRRGPGRARAAQAGPDRRQHAQRRRPHARRDRRGGRRHRRPEGRLPHRRPAQGHRRPVDPPRLARPGRLRRQARRPRAAAPPRAGSRLRVGDRVPQGGARAEDRRGRRRRDPQRGAGRRSRDAGDARRDRGARRRGARRTWSRSSPTAASPAAPTG